MKTFKAYLQESYSFTLDGAKQLWRELNKACFHGQLHGPHIYVEQNLNHLAHSDLADKFGPDDFILGYCDEDPDTHEIVLLLADKMTGPRELMEVLAHEMVHQALAEKHGYREMLEIGHGPQFMAYAPAIRQYYKLPLHGASY